MSIPKSDAYDAYPIRVLQFGEGNFLRGFADDFFDRANRAGVFFGSVAVIKPRAGEGIERLRSQEGRYTLLVRGLKDGALYEEKRVISCVSKALSAYDDYEAYAALAHLPSLKFVVSNTTEAGIAFDPFDSLSARPPRSFPGKLTKFLFGRYSYFHGDPERGLIVLPTELIEANGDALRSCVEKYIENWDLGDDFADWVDESCIFCNTLVDRIVSSYPEEEATALFAQLGYRDELLTIAEPQALWLIESTRLDTVRSHLGLDGAHLPIQYTHDLHPYRARKLRVLNGLLTAMAPVAFLAGKDTLYEGLQDQPLRAFARRVALREIAPTLSCLPPDEGRLYCEQMLERFANPYLNYLLPATMANAVEKWKKCILPTVKDCISLLHKIPQCLALSLAALVFCYRSDDLTGGVLHARRADTSYVVKDRADILSFFREFSTVLPPETFLLRLLSREDFWGEDLGGLEGFAGAVLDYYKSLCSGRFDSVLAELTAEA